MKKVKLLNEFQSNQMIYQSNIMKINKRIKKCEIQNKDDDNDLYKITIYFNWRWKWENKDEIHDDGKETFTDSSKDEIIEKIEKFVNGSHKGLIIE